jgi:flavin reductase
MSETAHRVVPLTSQSYRDAMAQLASAVHLVTTDGPGGRAGFTASSVCSVSDSPPTLLVCLNRASSAYPAFRDNDVLCVNTLAASQLAIAGSFGGSVPMDQRFASGTWRALSTGAPVLVGTLVAFDCRVDRRAVVGTHDVLFCEVVAIADADHMESLIYAQRRFQSLPRADPGGGARHVA